MTEVMPPVKMQEFATFSTVVACNRLQKPRSPSTRYSTLTLKLTAVNPETEAVTLTLPAVDGVTYVTLARPLPFVTTCEFDSLPSAPLSVKFTVAPETRFPYSSFTATTKGKVS